MTPSDRLSFGRFCGLGLEDEVPDATILSGIRIDLAEIGQAEARIGGLNRWLEQRDLVIKAGTMIHATSACIFMMQTIPWAEPEPPAHAA